MDMNDVKFNPNDVILWFNAIRKLPDDKRTRGLDAFWSGQINSKVWLCQTLNQYYNTPSTIHIFGGWIGVLASILFQSHKTKVKKIFNVDIDPWCKEIAETINEPNKKIGRFVSSTNDMSLYEYTHKPDIIINTSTEHVTQDIYDAWYKNIPQGSLVVIQGNDFFDCDEHVRCTKNLDEFKQINHVKNELFAGEKFFDIYNRYMCIFRKD